MATADQVVASLEEALALVGAGALTDSQMLALAKVATADLMRGRTTNYSVGGRSFGFSSFESALKAVEYFQRRVDTSGNSIAIAVAEL